MQVDSSFYLRNTRRLGNASYSMADAARPGAGAQLQIDVDAQRIARPNKSLLYSSQVRLDVVCMGLSRIEFNQQLQDNRCYGRYLTPDSSPGQRGLEFFVISVLTVGLVGANIVSTKRDIAPLSGLGFGRSHLIDKAAAVLWAIFFLAGQQAY